MQLSCVYVILIQVAFSPEVLKTSDTVTEILRSVFKKHGALRLSTPTLLPKCSLYENSENCVNFMDHCGGIVSLPYDLRV